MGGEQRRLRCANQGDTSPFHKAALVVAGQLVRRHERIGNAGERLVVRAHNDAEVGVQRLRGRRPHEVTKVLELGFVRVDRENQRERRVLTVLIALVRFEVRKPWKRVKRKRLRFHFRAEQACSLLQLTVVRKAVYRLP